MSDLLAWWAGLQMAALAGVPLAFLLLKRLPDRGYAFLKPLGLLSWGYLLWIGGSLHVYPNSRITILAVWLVLAAGAVTLLRARAEALRGYVRRRWRYLVAVELVFAGGLAIFGILRAYEPSIMATEKPMDLAMLTGILRSDFFPPQDPWLAGHGVSYYYGGYLQNAMLVSLFGVTSWVGYNLAVVGTGAVTAAAAFGLAWNIASLVRGERDGRGSPVPYVCGALAVLLLLFLGSGEGILELLAAHGRGSAGFFDWWGIDGLRPRHTDAWYPTEFFWWWRASRTTPDTIAEFPYFSFLLGDLHPHLMALPFGLAAVAVALHRLLQDGAVSAWQRRLEFGALALFLGGLAWINTWDLPTFGFVIVLAIALRKARAGALRGRGFAIEVAALIGLAVVLYLPFYITFRSQASGLLPDQSSGTRPATALLLWVPLLVLTTAILLRRGGRIASEHWALPLGLLALWALALFAWQGPGELHVLIRARGQAWLTVAGYGVLVAALVATLNGFRRRPGAAAAGWTLVTLCGMTGVLLLFGAELFYVRDVFDNRMNTVFKLSYQAWLLLAVAAAGGVLALAEMAAAPGLPRRLAAMAIGLLGTILVCAAMVYTVLAAFNRTEGFTAPMTLDGLAYLRDRVPGEYELNEWLWTLDPGTRIVEGNGRDYSDSARVSARSGLQAVIGWVGHEHQWRGIETPYEGRYEDVEEFYTTTDVGRALEILDKYGVDYVIVGPWERRRYPAAGLRKFQRRFSRAFEAGQVDVYAVPPP